MNWPLILGGIAALAVAVAGARRLFGGPRRAARTSYRKVDFLLSREERLFFRTLKEAVAGDYEIFAGIAAEDLLSPSREAIPEDDETLAGLRFPFVLCRPADLSIACAVQLRDHATAGRKAPAPADPLRSLCQGAGLPLVSVEAAPLYDAHEIREAVAAAIRKEPLFVIESDGRKEPRFSGLDTLEI